MSYPLVDRPPRNRRRMGEEGDEGLEQALMATLHTLKAIQIPIATFHSSPAKGRIWMQGYAVKHRVLPDKENVAAWVDTKKTDHEKDQS